MAGFVVSVDPNDDQAAAARFAFVGNMAAKKFLEKQQMNASAFLRDFETSCRYAEYAVLSYMLHLCFLSAGEMEEREKESANADRLFNQYNTKADMKQKGCGIFLRDFYRMNLF